MGNKQPNKSNIKIAYIGGGSRGWAWALMKDLALAKNISGQVALYDIDFEAAQHNEIIGNRIPEDHPQASLWEYKAEPTIEKALDGADFVVISILPGTFKEMESDVHAPEKYGIYQSVGDTTGPGGLIRALRTIPMFETIGKAIRDVCPNAWVINYTNPMTVCVRTLYRVFPGIKAFGCCHEVFSTQKLLCQVLEKIEGIQGLDRHDIETNVFGVNHFTWIDRATYGKKDILPLYREYIRRVRSGELEAHKDLGAQDLVFESNELVKMDLFMRTGVIAAAGDRHLAEFVPLNWYMKDPEQVASWGYGLTPVSWRWQNLQERMDRSKRLLERKEAFDLTPSGEDGVEQIRAILGIGDMISNVNLPNMGQIPNLPLGAVVETNALFTHDTVRPVMAGALPDSVYALVAPVVAEQEMIVEAALSRDLELAFEAFMRDSHMPLAVKDARCLFDTMIENTKEYLPGYKL